MTKTIAIIVLWRDSSNYINKSLKQFEYLETQLSKSYQLIYSFYENDSIDNTENTLREWLRNRKGFLKTEKTRSPKWGSIQSKKRTYLLGKYRNICLNSLREIAYTHLLIVDSDIVYESSLIVKMIMLLEKNNLMGMITANTIQDIPDQIDREFIPYSYYDSWALVDKRGNQGLTYAENPLVEEDDRLNWFNGERIIVNSAFGGIALARGELIREKRILWDGTNGCEHWHFCEKIRQQGYTIEIDPLLTAKVSHPFTGFKDPIVISLDKSRLSLAKIKNKKKSIDRIKYTLLVKILRMALLIKHLLARTVLDNIIKTYKILYSLMH